MALLQTIKISKSFITQTILKDVSLQIMPGEKVGLIGLNGVGKTTLFHLILKKDIPDGGEIRTRTNLKIAHMAQDFFSREKEISLYQFIMKAFTPLLHLEKEIHSLEEEMGQVGSKGDDAYQQVMKKYSHLTQIYQEKGGYEYESRIRGVLKGLGFQEDSFHSPLSTFSGGEKSRAELGRLLLSEPDLLLLDEPTNHLDIKTREWFEEYLSSYPSAIIIISHDRYFLNQTVTRLWELYQGHLEKYPGNYSFYLKEKDRRYAFWEKQYQQQQEYIARQEEIIRRNHAGNYAGQARSRKKQLENLPRIPPPLKRPQLPHISFLYGGASGRKVLEVEGLSHRFSGKEILSSIHLQVFQGEKIVLLGDNGSGKTTLFKILLSLITPIKGVVKYGVNVKTAYYLQEHENLSKGKSILQEMLAMGLSYEEVRTTLGGLLFHEEDSPKLVEELSGGERSRLALAKLIVTPSNLLLLDEPTNHLDILSRGRLEKAIKEYKGTCIIITHDRYFIHEVAHKIWELSQGEIREYPGDYSFYQEQKRREREGKKEEVPLKKVKKALPKGPKKKEKIISVQDLEEEITLLEEERKRMEEDFTKEEFYHEAGEVIRGKKDTYRKILEDLKVMYQRWEEELS